jgi:signal peptidase II
VHRLQDRRALTAVAPRAGTPLAARRVTAAVVVGVAAAAVVLDQIVKTVAEHALRGGHTVDLVFGARLVLTYNSGAAFSVGTGRSGVFTVFASITVAALLAYAVWLRQRPLQAISFGLILGGAAGNLTDRLLRPNGGQVIDFLEIAKWWPVFNVADIALFCGVALMLLLSWNRAN